MSRVVYRVVHGVVQSESSVTEWYGLKRFGGVYVYTKCVEPLYIEDHTFRHSGAVYWFYRQTHSLCIGSGDLGLKWI